MRRRSRPARKVSRDRLHERRLAPTDFALILERASAKIDGAEPPSVVSALRNFGLSRESAQRRRATSIFRCDRSARSHVGATSILLFGISAAVARVRSTGGSLYLSCKRNRPHQRVRKHARIINESDQFSNGDGKAESEREREREDELETESLDRRLDPR